jgi:CRISPR-associated protein Csm4
MPLPLLIRLDPLGPFRFGLPSGARDQSGIVFHSDSLFSAVCSAMERLGELDEWLAVTAGGVPEPAVRLSSCFPAVRDLLFVPPPRSHWPPPGFRLRWKAARFVPVTAVRALTRGESLSEDRWTVDVRSGCLLPIERNVPLPPPFRVALRSAAAVDRANHAATEVHTTACLEFAEEAGLWCMAVFAGDAARERWSRPLEAALRLLGDSGIGGERSRGWGRFTCRFQDRDPLSGLAGPSEAGQWWMLSVFSPREDEAVAWDRGDYTIAERSGRVEKSGVPTLTVRMVEEGSVLVAPAAPVGAARDVAPEGFEHPVYRAGFAVAVPLPARRPAAAPETRTVAEPTEAGEPA